MVFTGQCIAQRFAVLLGRGTQWDSVVLSGQGLLAGLTAAPSIPAAQGLFLKPIGIPLEDRSCCWDKVHLLA